ncbi:helix-turn-helix domain-containing protein [Niallia sp. NCCP-28]|uniref:helix-turn-helix domain-containing protein n=1 Tax=Niallia sp. NCCP-28 TaxID=2934712 RepID=UPI0020863183|nr:helix-turn-helix domain-containing protein [Niallia sp. NCCP-28]GKU81040.1 hypothetical protein NCCP28_04360 [Niallia sp. NCCP-28]
MPFIEIIVLYCLHNISGERTIYSILHILNGKKSSQTIQDIHLFQLTMLFQTFPELSRKDFQAIMETLKGNGWLEELSEQHVVIRKEKQSELEMLIVENPIPERLNGWTYHQQTSAFWERLSLFVQVAAHLKAGKRRYIPVQRDRSIQVWLKETLASINIPRDKISEKLYGELMACLDHDDIDPRYFVIRLTGCDNIGLTVHQGAQQLQVDKDYYHVYFLSILHFMMDRIRKLEDDFPLLQKIIKKTEQNLPLTLSTAKTYQYIQRGYNIEEISTVRQLKENTIEDHIVEIILNIPTFPISEYISENSFVRVKNCVEKLGTKSLKFIKENLQDISYFEIRVVLAKLGDKI